MLMKIWKFMKPKNIHQVVYLIGGIIAGLLLWPEVQIIMDHQGFISEERLIDTAMTKRWMLLDQRNTTGVKFKSKTGTRSRIVPSAPGTSRAGSIPQA